MLRSSTLALVAVLSIGSAAMAQQDEADFQPGPQNNPDSCSQLWQGIGLPEYGDTDRDATIVCHSRYVLSHSNEDKTPDWVIERLTRAQVSGKNRRPKVKFQSEELVRPAARALDKDYAGSKFDRGHQAPSEDFNADADWMVESFILSNIVPQVGRGFNQGIWKDLEALVRKLAVDRGEIYVITGPIYRDADGRALPISRDANPCRKTIVFAPPQKTAICDANDKNVRAVCEAGVTVPVGLYKIIYDPRRVRANAYILPNLDHRLTQKKTDSLEYLERFRTSVHVVEDQTGLRFLLALDERTRRPQINQCVATMLH